MKYSNFKLVKQTKEYIHATVDVCESAPRRTLLERVRIVAPRRKFEHTAIIFSFVSHGTPQWYFTYDGMFITDGFLINFLYESYRARRDLKND